MLLCVVKVALGLALAGSAGHVVLGDRTAALAGDGNEVERSVELAVAAAWAEPIADLGSVRR